MARALTVQRTLVPPSERKRYLERMRGRQAYYQRAKCNFWVFEEMALPGAFIEFTEAADASILSAAHAGAPDGILDPTRIYDEVELS